MKRKVSFYLCTLIICITLFAPSIMGGVVNNQKITLNNAVSYTNISSITNFDMYSTRYGYDSLANRTYGAEKQALYNEFYDAAVSLWNNSYDIVPDEIDGKLYYTIKSIDLTSYYNLGSQEFMEVYITFKNDNPLFYFASNSLQVVSGHLLFLAYEDYASGSVRNNCQSAIINGINDFGQSINGKSSEFDIMITLHDKITTKINYAYKSDGITPEDAAWAHNIMGYFDSSIKKGVCECYARTLQLAMFVGGIDNLIVTGTIINTQEKHAWNIAKLDDGKYYYIDATFNDTSSTYDYLAKGSVLHETHAINYSTSTGEQYLYDLPEVDGNYLATTNGTITISSAADLKYLSIYDKGNFVLGGNIDLSNRLSENNGHSYFNITFAGTFDGKGYTIKGVKTALFEEVGTNGVIKNLKVDADFNGSSWNNVKEICPQYKTAIAYTNNGTIKDCEVTFKITDGKGRELQTIFCSGVTNYNYGTISNCTANINSVSFSDPITEFLFLSGIAYENYGTISNCTGKLNVKNTSADISVDAAGIVGTNMEKSTIDNCTSNGSVTGAPTAHTTISGICSNNMYGSIKNCTNNASATITTGGMLYAGGICTINSSLVEKCTNNGSITNNYGDTIIGMASGIGGISGLNARNATIKDCTNTANLSIHTGEAGGIVGSAWAESTIKNCINKGDISGIDAGNDIPRRGFHVGGILGYASLDVFYEDENGNRIYHDGTITIDSCTNEGKITSIFGQGHAGCIVCSIYITTNDAYVNIKNCTSTGIAYYNERWENSVFGYYYHEATGSSEQNGNLITTGCDTSKTTYTDLISGNSGNSGNSGGNNSKPNNNKPSNNTTTETTDETSEETSETTDTTTDTETTSSDEATTSDADEENTTTNKEASDKTNEEATKEADDEKSSSNTWLIVLIVVIILGVLGGGGAAVYIFVIKKKISSKNILEDVEQQ